MSSKRNPFNDNVNHLMEKIFSGAEKTFIPRESYQDETIPQPPRGQEGRVPDAREADVLHRTAGERVRTAGEAGMDFAVPHRIAQGNAQSAGENGTTQHPPLSEFTLQDIRRTTEKLREAAKQMQQMTLQMWAETVQTRSGQENAVRQEENERHRNIVRRENQAGHYNKVVSQHEAGYPGAGGPVHRVFAPQYRMEEVLDAAVPERIRECKQLARSPQGCRMTREELFFRQGQLMADYEDDCLYPGEFTWYFPTYQAMNAAQLRGYFTWRAQVRQGNVMPTSLSFAFVYMYELLHQIGVETPQEGFRRLKSFWESYREFDSQLDRYMKNWLCDYVVYYNLDRELLIQSANTAFDNALLVFLQPEAHTDDEYFAAVCALSKYNMEGSKFYREYPEDVRRVTCGVFRALDAYYAKHGKKTLSEKYFGTLTSCAYQMFASAVFYDYKKYADYVYVINDIHRYRCTNGRWVCERYFGSRTKNQDMGFVLRAIDARMRERYEYKAPLKPEGMTKLVMNIIEKEIDKLFAQKKKNAVPVIEIDVTKLSAIRRASELTKERLIVEDPEEELGAVFVPETEQQALGRPGTAENAGYPGNMQSGTAGQMRMAGDAGCQGTAQEDSSGLSGQLEFLWENDTEPEEIMKDAPKKAAASAEPAKIPANASAGGTCGLTAAEQILLRHLLDGTPYQSFLREKHLMLSVVVDGINEKLYDRFGDTVIVFNGDTPEVLEDYVQEAEILAGGGE